MMLGRIGKGKQMKTFVVDIIGAAPVLMHSTAGMSEEKQPGVRTKLPTGRGEAETGAYRDADGHLCIPSVAFGRAIFQAASGIKVGKLTARSALAGVFIDGEYAKLLDPETGEPVGDFEVDTRFVKVARGRVPRSRARISAWTARLSFTYDEGLIDEQAIRELLARAGSIVGVGDYRPATGGGPFGRFVLR
jgi:hypothetical protein